MFDVRRGLRRLPGRVRGRDVRDYGELLEVHGRLRALLIDHN